MAIPIFRKEGIEKWVRIAFIANAAVTPLIAIVYFYPVYSMRLLLLGFPWAATAPLSMLMLALLFKKNYKRGYQRLKHRKYSTVLVDVDEAEEY
jgi:hypothetical protein